MTKINVGTALNIAFTGAVRDYLGRDSELVDPRRYLAEARAAMVPVVRRVIETLSEPVVTSIE